MPTVEEKQADSGRQQHLFREVNDRIREIVGVHPFDGEGFEILCECADFTCARTLPISVAVYDEVRSNAKQFINLPGHNIPDVERTVAESGSYVVVEKFGEGGRMAALLATSRRGSPAPS